MQNSIALIPAKTRSVGIPDKNWRPLGHSGMSCVARAVLCAVEAAVGTIVVSTDREFDLESVFNFYDMPPSVTFRWRLRPAELCADDTPMKDVVADAVGHALSDSQVDGDTILLLLQPTSPLRTPEHLTRAVRVLRQRQAAATGDRPNSIASVVPVPSPHAICRIGSNGGLQSPGHARITITGRRQTADPCYRLDGTVYAARIAAMPLGGLHAPPCHPMILSPDESLTLDEPHDWARAEDILGRYSG